MKKILLLCVVICLFVAGSAFAGLTGTPHHITGGLNGEICVACHTPHGAVGSSYGPLWNRTPNTLASAYTYYVSATFDMSQPALIAGPQSLACLSCHNGVASDLVNYPGPGNPDNNSFALSSGNLTSGFSNVGTDLRDDHPVGFQYVPGDDANNNLFPAIGAANLVASNMYVFDNASLGGGYFDDAFECATCHDVHNVAVPARSPVYFLRTTNANSAMCTACHTNKM